MDPVVRRIVAVSAHAARTGRLPKLVCSLGNGEATDIRPTDDGFVETASGLAVRLAPPDLAIEGFREPLRLELEDDVFFAGYDPGSGERFTGRCGGGSSVTIYESASGDYFQYALAAD